MSSHLLLLNVLCCLHTINAINHMLLLLLLLLLSMLHTDVYRLPYLHRQ